MRGSVEGGRSCNIQNPKASEKKSRGPRSWIQAIAVKGLDYTILLSKGSGCSRPPTPAPTPTPTLTPTPTPTLTPTTPWGHHKCQCCHDWCCNCCWLTVAWSFPEAISLTKLLFEILLLMAPKCRERLLSTMTKLLSVAILLMLLLSLTVNAGDDVACEIPLPFADGSGFDSSCFRGKTRSQISLLRSVLSLCSQSSVEVLLLELLLFVGGIRF